MRDAGEYIAALPENEAHAKHWQVATECLIAAADRGGIVMFADIAVRRALARMGRLRRNLSRARSARRHTTTSNDDVANRRLQADLYDSLVN